MAEKKKMSQAEKAASAAKRQVKQKSSEPVKKTPDSASGKPAAGKEFNIPGRLIASAVFLVLFVVLLWTAFRPAGSIWPSLEKLL